MAQITVNRQNAIAVSVNNRSGVLTPGVTGAVILKNQSTGGGSTTLSGLNDVALTSDPPTDGSTVQYDSGSSKFKVQQMNIDGGTF